jgi:dTDP-4-amino-4,6-dideoxygalactose transaminase
MVGEEEIAEVVDTLRSGWISTGPKTKRFESEFATYVGTDAALALASCTAGLHLALAALGVGPGDEVITTPYTFCSTANVIEHVGATTVLADVQPDTLNIDPAAVDAAITARTKAIVAVHLAGHPADLDEIHSAAEPHEIAVVQDAAHSLPALYRGRRIGSDTDLTAFSFYATKNLTTAEGGMLTGASDLVEQARVLSLHGMNRDAWQRYARSGSWFYEVVSPGYKYNMTDIQASLGVWQLRKLEGFQRRRHQVAAAYTEAFSQHECFEVPTVRSYVTTAWHLYVLRLRTSALTIDRAQFIQELAARNIGTSVHFIPIHVHPYYSGKYHWSPHDFPIAFDSYERAISLPLHPGLSDADVADVVHAVIDVADKHTR